ncbi:MAG: ABC transporter permease subunit [Phycisphaerae bacterium]|nr:ABC transporter permease subunit [Phycisphaerae bacterium]
MRPPLQAGMLSKSIREIWPVTFALGLVALALEAALAYVLPVKFQADFADQWMKLGFVQNIMRIVLGADVSGGIGPEVMAALAWAHPAVLALFFAHAIIVCTRIPAGEIDRGTADTLLALPVSRWQILCSDAAAWLAAGVVLLAFACGGNLLGGSAAPPSSRVASERTLPVLANLYCLYVASGGIAYLASSFGDRKGRAMTGVFILVLVSFLLNYLSQLWQPLERFAFLSLLRYYQPLTLMRSGAWPIRDMLILATVGLATWTAAGVVFSRRDIATA